VVRRRSAVERLQETKANYVKSEYVRDSQQHFKHLSQIIDPLNRNHFEVQSLYSISPDHRKSPLTTKYMPSTSFTTNSGFLNRNRSTLVNRLNQSSCNNLDSSLKSFLNKSQEYSSPFELENVQPSSSSPSSSSPSKSPVLLGKSLTDLNYEKDSSLSPTLNQDKSSETNSANKSKYAMKIQNSPSHGNSYLRASDIVNALKSSIAIVKKPSKTSTISRSKSDIGHRFNKQTKPKSKDEIERFFDTIGLDSTTWASITANSTNHSLTSTPPHFFNSTHSIDSNTRHLSVSSDSLHSPRESSDQPCNELSNLKLSQLSRSVSKETSIVEKNARIIKWMYNCKKAMVDEESIN